MPGLFRTKTDAQKWQKSMDKLLGEYAPLAISETLTEIAQDVQFRSIVNMKGMFLKVGKYSANSLRTWKASPMRNIARIRAVTGSISPYLDLQDSGGTARPQQGKLMPTPSKASRGGSLANPILPRFRVSKMGDLKNRSADNKFFLLGSGQKNRPWLIVRRYAKGRLVWLRALDRTEVRLKPHAWHRKAVQQKATQKAMMGLFLRNMKALVK